MSDARTILVMAIAYTNPTTALGFLQHEVMGVVLLLITMCL